MTVSAPAAVSTLSTPPGRVVTGRASPAPLGSSQRAVSSPAPPPLPLPAPSGAGRLEVNSSEPSGRNRGLPSPSAERVSLRAGPPAVSTRQMLETYFLPSGP